MVVVNSAVKLRLRSGASQIGDLLRFAAFHWLLVNFVIAALNVAFMMRNAGESFGLQNRGINGRTCLNVSQSVALSRIPGLLLVRFRSVWSEMLSLYKLHRIDDFAESGDAHTSVAKERAAY